MKCSFAVIITALAAFAAAAPVQDFYVIGKDGQIYARDALPQGRFGGAIKAAKTVIGGLGDKVLDLGKTTPIKGAISGAQGIKVPNPGALDFSP
ncbi:hypothetical protein CKM354_001147900 [Cercospora kikuchii]|uniref:Uncharacterized protein n=1 Tax=Cercospora kikuchii TaxID=84275 RepID=A0A9P3D0D3_9PEZI|nr:uncharacterized protein CKM354_001147900 [Cercospora kikuchii]GIZ48418.1 hypothetical protein CKM354_001147900 [Cercospora kikuchii]